MVSTLVLYRIRTARPAPLVGGYVTVGFRTGHPAIGVGRKGPAVGYTPETPFDSIEGSHEYVALLAEALAEARRDVEAEVAAAERDHADRRKEALLLVSFNLAKLHLHIASSRRILNDLRTLRRLLLAERQGLVESDAEDPKPS